MAPSPTPILDRLNRIRDLRDTPRPLYPIKPTPMAPFVRAAREKRLRPSVLCGGSFVPRGEGDAA